MRTPCLWHCYLGGLSYYFPYVPERLKYFLIRKILKRPLMKASPAGVWPAPQVPVASLLLRAGGPAVGPHRLPRLGCAGGQARSCGRPAVRTWRAARDVPAHGGPDVCSRPGLARGQALGERAPQMHRGERMGRHLGGPPSLPNRGPRRNPPSLEACWAAEIVELAEQLG